jgi:DNA polymerase/3'-5' exonuclease PolX
MNDINKNIVKHFDILIKLLRVEHNLLVKKIDRISNGYKITVLTRNMIAISKMKNKIKSSDDVKGLKGFGKGTLTRIDEIIKTGSLSEILVLKEKHEKMKKMNKVIEDLTSIIGVGMVNAIELVQKHKVTSITDLKSKIKNKKLIVNDKIMIGLKYMGKYTNKIERSIITTIRTRIDNYIIDKHLSWMICGSYRREKPFSSDIDLLICDDRLITNDQVKESNVLSKVINNFKEKKFITGDITSSEVKSKYMGFCSFNKQLYRLDIRLVPKHSWITSIAYFTGSYQHNILMRNRAIKMGMKLSEYGLYYENGQQIHISSEQELFQILKIPYLEPNER